MGLGSGGVEAGNEVEKGSYDPPHDLPGEDETLFPCLELYTRQMPGVSGVIFPCLFQVLLKCHLFSETSPKNFQFPSLAFPTPLSTLSCSIHHLIP